LTIDIDIYFTETSTKFIMPKNRLNNDKKSSSIWSSL